MTPTTGDLRERGKQSASPPPPRRLPQAGLLTTADTSPHARRAPHLTPVTVALTYSTRPTRAAAAAGQLGDLPATWRPKRETPCGRRGAERSGARRGGRCRLPPRSFFGGRAAGEAAWLPRLIGDCRQASTKFPGRARHRPRQRRHVTGFRGGTRDSSSSGGSRYRASDRGQ